MSMLSHIKFELCITSRAHCRLPRLSVEFWLRKNVDTRFSDRGQDINRMDASAYLKRHGWRGDGHSLDLTDRGIRKPLLVSRKVDVLGLGINKHAAVSDQWWMRAFDQGLKSLGTGKESTLNSVRKHGVHRGGLYGRFVKGEGVPGTIGTKGWISYMPAEKCSTDESKTLTDGTIESVAKCSVKKRKREAGPTKQKNKGQARKSKAMPEEVAGANRIHSAAQPYSQGSTGDDVTKGRRIRKLSVTKLANYQKRANEKGMTVDEYIKRREKKYAARKVLRPNRPV